MTLLKTPETKIGQDFLKWLEDQSIGFRIHKCCECEEDQLALEFVLEENKLTDKILLAIYADQFVNLSRYVKSTMAPEFVLSSTLKRL